MPDTPERSPADAGPPALSATGVGRDYGDLRALSGFDLELHRGEVLGLLGTNGAGKTTALSILAGVMEPSHGHVKVLGRSLSTDATAARREIGYLPEEPPLYRELRVEEFLRHCAVLHRIPAASARASVERAMERCDLGEVRRRLIGNLSKGYRQRVGIAQAVIHEPAVLILDEPTVGLDPVQMQHVRALITELGREHAVILSSHVLPEVQSVCGRVRIIHRGRSVYEADLNDSGDGQLELKLTSPPPAESLRAITGVREAVPTEGGYMISVLQGADPRSELLRTAVASGWGPTGLRLVPDDLEHRFMALVSGEQSEQGPS